MSRTVPASNELRNPTTMHDLLLFAGLIGAWLLLQLWILPGLGVQT